MGWTPRKLLDHKGELKESNIRPREIPAPKDSVFLADVRSRQESSGALRKPGTNFLEGVENDLRSTENGQNESHSQNHLDERMTPHLSIQDNIPMCQECGRDSSKYPRRLSADQTNDDYNSISIAPKTSNKSKSRTLSGSQIVESVALNNADFNRERTNRRNVPNNVDFNRTRLPELGQEKQLSFKKSDGGTKSKVGRLISQFQEFAKASFKQSR